jgi:hypothetical protein
VAVIEENGHRLIPPGSGEDQIGSEVAVDIAGCNLQAASRSDNSKELRASGGEL